MANLFHEVRDRLEAAFASYEPEPLAPTVARSAGAWPVEQADIFVLDPTAPVALCTLGDLDLARRLAKRRPSGRLALVGPMATENLGVEKLVRNVVTSPSVRTIILAGPETGGSAPTGHYAGDALCCLLEYGVDSETMRIREAKGRRPLLKNLTPEEIELFRRRVVVVDRRGLADPDAIWAEVESAGDGWAMALPKDLVPGAVAGTAESVPVVEAGTAPRGFQKDPGGYFILYADHRKARLVVEHYSVDDERTVTIVGDDPEAIAQTAIERGLVTTLDHAVYLGRELDRAHTALSTRRPYVQDDGAGR